MTAPKIITLPPHYALPDETPLELVCAIAVAMRKTPDIFAAPNSALADYCRKNGIPFVETQPIPTDGPAP